jgi:beta-glucosidase/6-phospho-beta-glucosidase/beta-galactosidase
MRPLEIWGGHECTVNRVGDTWRDQSRLTGHHDRLEDLDRFAALGLRTLRYPVLWERTETSPGCFDWSWADERLGRLRALGIRPIVGLIHHGSGPAWTDLLDPGFAEGLVAFAARVAERYPWVRDWTPVNEPLTTARFSALYGHWYPHARDEGAFWRALLNQVEAVGLAMKAIREITPGARLVQTEDFGNTWATAPCRLQADFENRRRLMTWDLLTGRVDPDHPFWARIAAHGLSGLLARLAKAPCPPDILGLNHYVTSDRFLDHRLERYPPEAWGGNGEIAYADVEAVRVLEDRGCGWERSLRTLWRRYRLPIAITECHLGCTPPEQRRWLLDAFEAISAVRDEGVDARALTVWSLLGAVDWDSLLTRPAGHYEAGVFDVLDGEPQPTPLAATVSALCDGGPSSFPLSDGWWNRPDRLLYPACSAGEMSASRL